ncbi:protein SYM1-like [Curcuma longa]|uniref:protein SYM1-like n=1 Tax=Curcuma longa TaxID=136217 RepID=UPI003D9ED0B9
MSSLLLGNARRQVRMESFFTAFPLRPPVASAICQGPAIGAAASIAAAAAAAPAAAASSSSVPIRNGFLSWYLRMIEAHPLTTKSLTAAFIFGTADMSSQIITTAWTASLDIVRILRMSGYGLLVLGPSLHFWFNFISKILPKQDIITILKKILLAQTTFGPLMTGVFFSMNAFLQGESGDEIFSRLKRDLIPTIKTGFLYWPLCDFITFKFAPVQLQPLACNSFSFLWTIYLTHKASLKKVSDQENSTS